MNLKAHKDPCGRVWIGDEDKEIGDPHRINHISFPQYERIRTRNAMFALAEEMAAARKMREALQALGIHPFQMEDGTPAHGYCFCPQPHPGAPEDEHTGECRDARAALEAAGVDLVTVAP